MRRGATLLILGATLALAGCGAGGGAPGAAPTLGSPSAGQTGPGASAPPEVPGMVVFPSDFDVAETAERVRGGLAEAGMVTAVVDHAANAASVGEQLRPTTLVIGGAPRAGTPIMQRAQTAGLDLPQKFLAWRAADGGVYLGYNAADYVGARAGIPADSPALDRLGTASKRIAAAASGTGEPATTGPGEVSGEGYLVEQTSTASVADTIAGYERAVQDKPPMVVATVDHARGASSIDEQLRPTRVTFLANPEVGTQLLQASQTMGIDLPVRFLSWRDEAGTVRAGYPDIRALVQRHGATGAGDAVGMVEKATDMLTTAATGSGR